MRNELKKQASRQRKNQNPKERACNDIAPFSASRSELKMAQPSHFDGFQWPNPWLYGHGCCEVAHRHGVAVEGDTAQLPHDTPVPSEPFPRQWHPDDSDLLQPPTEQRPPRSVHRSHPLLSHLSDSVRRPTKASPPTSSCCSPPPVQPPRLAPLSGHRIHRLHCNLWHTCGAKCSRPHQKHAPNHVRQILLRRWIVASSTMSPDWPRCVGQLQSSPSELSSQYPVPMHVNENNQHEKTEGTENGDRSPVAASQYLVSKHSGKTRGNDE